MLQLRIIDFEYLPCSISGLGKVADEGGKYTLSGGPSIRHPNDIVSLTISRLGLYFLNALFLSDFRTSVVIDEELYVIVVIEEEPYVIGYISPFIRTWLKE